MTSYFSSIINPRGTFSQQLEVSQGHIVLSKEPRMPGAFDIPRDHIHELRGRSGSVNSINLSNSDHCQTMDSATLKIPHLKCIKSQITLRAHSSEWGKSMDLSNSDNHQNTDSSTSFNASLSCMQATGNPNPDQDHGKTNTKNTSENRHGGSITLLRSLDLADRIKGYRLLELISEKASNGLLWKVIISQESTSRFINYFSPDTSLMRVDFAVLDQFMIRPIGIHGSKSEIACLLQEINAVDEHAATLLLKPPREEFIHTVPSLASGLYIFETPSETETAKRFYVIYWPEDTTWVTLVRYLTEITNQILALVSLDQAQALKFKESASYDLAGGKKGHIVSFKVAKAGYQCEDVTAHPRFEAHRAMSVMVTILICLLLCASRPSIRIAEPRSQCPIEYQPALESILAVGGTQQAFLAMESQRETFENSQSVQTMAETHLRSERREKPVCLGEEPNDNVLTILSKLYLDSRFSVAVSGWGRQKDSSERTLKDSTQLTHSEIESKVHEHRGRPIAALVNTTTHHTLEHYKLFYGMADFASESSWTADQVEVNASNAYGRLETCTHRFIICNTRGHKPSTPINCRRSPNASYSRIRSWLSLISWTPMTNEKKKLVDVTLSHHDHHHSLPEYLSVDKSGEDKNMGLQVVHTVTEAAAIDIRSSKEAVDPGKRSDSNFISSLPDVCNKVPLLLNPALKTGQGARDTLKRNVDGIVNRLYEELDKFRGQLFRENEKKSFGNTLMEGINNSYVSGSATTLGEVSESNGSWSSSPRYDVSVWQGLENPARLCHTIHLLPLIVNDRPNLLGSRHENVPRSQLRSQPPNISLPLGHRTRHIQLLQSRCLLIVSDKHENLKVYLDDVDILDKEIEANHTKASFSYMGIGPDVKITVDETLSLLAFVSSDRNDNCRLHVYRLAENLSSLALLGTPISLHSEHYGPLRNTNVCFVSGQQEVFLVDNHREGRIYSFLTRQWRPTTLHFSHQPSKGFSIPDGACLVAIEQKERLRARVYHWASFGSSPGVVFDLSDTHSTSDVTPLPQRDVEHGATRDEQFVFLKDGVWSPDFERSLIETDLNQDVKNLSFGWYDESLLQWYFRGRRKVKVISSMRQQGMGESYMINHLTDCSFQDSAKHTTKGWISRLDSIERSSQEDAPTLRLSESATGSAASHRLEPVHLSDLDTSYAPVRTLPGLPFGSAPPDPQFHTSAAIDAKGENAFFSSTGGTVDSQTTKSEDLIVVQTQVPYQSLWSSGIGKSSAHHHHPFSFPSPSSARIPQTPTNSPDPSVPQPLPASSIDVVIHTSIPHTKPPCFNHLAMIDILDKLRVARQAVTQLETDLQNTVDTIVGTRLCP